MNLLNTKHSLYATLWCAFLFRSTILDAILKLDFFQTTHDAVFERAWSDKPEEGGKDNKRSELFDSYTCIMLMSAIFSAICRPF